MTAVERLEALLDEKDQELAELQEQIQKQEDWMTWAWARHTQIDDDPLPTPRLEMEAVNDDGSWYVTTFRTSIVFKHFLGHSVRIPIDFTKRTGGRNQAPSPSDWPWRQGAHFAHESQFFGWPAYVRIEDRLWLYKGRAEDRTPVMEEVSSPAFLANTEA